MKHRWRYWWVWLLVAAYIAFIFHNSLEVAAASDAISYSVAEKFLHFLQRFSLYSNDCQLFNHYIRKAAHFTEFAGLGFLVSLAMHICPLFKHRSLNLTLFLVAIPFADETIQKFVEGRSSQASDMLIDGSGFLAGAFFCYILILVIMDLSGYIQRGRPKQKTEV
ncbi:MAG: VanZ family protein [Erysipelotrichia bacterium]|nr:VanZ family protein [Erysipelotrichia bacterium]